MDAILKVNWDTINDNMILGDHIPMPDGTEHYIEMSMLHWYWAHFIVEDIGSRLEDMAQDVLDVIAEDNGEGDFDELFRVALIAYGKGWVQRTTGRRPVDAELME